MKMHARPRARAKTDRRGRFLTSPPAYPPRVRVLCGTLHVHVHVNLPSRQDAQPQAPWRPSVGGAKCGAHAHGNTHTRHTQTHTGSNRRRKGGGSVKVVREEAKGASSRSRTLPARMYRGWAAALAPRPLTVRLSLGPPRWATGRVVATLRVVGGRFPKNVEPFDNLIASCMRCT